MRPLWTCRACGKSVAYSARPRCPGGTYKKHCGCKNRATYEGSWRDQPHVRRRINERKTAYRIAKAEASGRSFKHKFKGLHDAHVRTTVAIRNRLLRLSLAKHDAHVKRYLYLQRARQKSYKSYQRDPELIRARQRERKQALVKSYVIQNLKASGFTKQEITPHLVELKREQIQARRISLELKRAVKNHYRNEK